LASVAAVTMPSACNWLLAYCIIDARTEIAGLVVSLEGELNGCHFTASEGDAVLKTLALAARELDEAGYAAWLRENSRKAGRGRPGAV